MTALCGLAANFAQLLAARIGVAVGEAGCVAPAHSIISDYYPPERRAFAISVFSSGASIGTGGGITALSNPDEEVEETRVKARALIAVLGGAVPAAPDAGGAAATDQPDANGPRRPDAIQ